MGLRGQGSTPVLTEHVALKAAHEAGASSDFSRRVTFVFLTKRQKRKRFGERPGCHARAPPGGGLPSGRLRAHADAAEGGPGHTSQSRVVVQSPLSRHARHRHGPSHPPGALRLAPLCETDPNAAG